MFKRVFVALSLAALLAAIAVPAALAHERRQVGDYQLVVGFFSEPAFEGQLNGVSVRVTDTTQDPPAGITGLAETLEVEVTHLATNEKRTMPLGAVFGQEGAYAAYFVPTASGGYSFRFFGEIGGVSIDETFTSGPDTFDEVQAARDVQFPVQLAEARELQDAVTGAQNEATEAAIIADDANSQASLAMTIGIVGIVAGALGLGLGGYAVMRESRKK